VIVLTLRMLTTYVDIHYIWPNEHSNGYCALLLSHCLERCKSKYKHISACHSSTCLFCGYPSLPMKSQYVATLNFDFQTVILVCQKEKSCITIKLPQCKVKHVKYGFKVFIHSFVCQLYNLSPGLWTQTDTLSSPYNAGGMRRE
jgi:hypothetical protein